MATSTSLAASSLNAAPVLPGAVGAGASARFGATTTGAFASVLDQLGQPIAAATTAVSQGPDAAVASAPAVVPAVPDQPSPTAPLLATPVPLQVATPLQTHSIVGAPDGQPLSSSAGTSPKIVEKKGKPGPAAEPDPPSPISTADAPPPPIPVADLIWPLTTSPTATSSVLSGTSTTTPTDPASPSTDGFAPIVGSEPAPAAANPAVAPALPKATLATPATSSTETPASSRMAGQAAIATQAGLSVDEDHEDDRVPSPEQQTEPHLPNSAISHAIQGSPAPPATLPPPSQLAITPTPIASVVPGRIATSAPVRSSDPDAPSKPASPTDLATSIAPPSPVATPESQALPPGLSPPITLAAAGPITPATRPAPPTPSLPSPATQVAQAIAEPVNVVMTSPAQAGSTAPHVTTIQITPVELGRVEVRIERTSDGPAKIQLIAERTETLSRLVHDQSQLQQALDQVGIPQNSRTIEFSLAPAAPNAGAFSSSLSGNNASGGDSPGSEFQRQSNPYYNQNLHEADDNTLGSITNARVVRTGIDITA